MLSNIKNICPLIYKYNFFFLPIIIILCSFSTKFFTLTYKINRQDVRMVLSNNVNQYYSINYTKL